jgi:regulator of sigma E protease
LDPFQNTQPNHGRDAKPGDESAPPAEMSLRPWLVRNGPYVVFVLALLLWFCIKQEFDLGKIFALFKVALGLGLVIFIHELGHFLVAKWCDVHVETFSIGFGPPIPGCVFRRGETTYMIALFPLGGYVKMVGEGPEEEAEDDPRSFKNKPVWQRMAIISAGVTMNVLLALVFFVYVFLTHGATRLPGVIDRVEPGSPAWVEGMRPGDVIYWFGNKGPLPYFNDVRPIIVNSRKDEAIPVVFGPPNLPTQQWQWQKIVARRDKDDTRPVIGIFPPSSLKLLPPKVRASHELPVSYNSAAAQATPSFEFGDAIIGTTDPQHPEDLDRILPLTEDPRYLPPNPDHLDYFEFRRRMHLLAGKPLAIQVRRENSTSPVDIRVPPAYYRTLGLRMPMDKIAAVRDDSPAAKAGLDPDRFDYYIEKLTLTDASGHSIRYPEEVKDPLRLPDDLQRWAESHPGAKKATLVLIQAQVNPSASSSNRGHHPAQEKITRELPWQDDWELSTNVPIGQSAPIAIEGLGIAFRVNATVEAVEPGSAAALAGLRKDDKIVGFRFYEPGKKQADHGKPLKEWKDLKANQWASVFELLQVVDIPKLDLRFERDGRTEDATLEAQEDTTWPRDDRGLLLEPDRRLQKADNLAQAVSMGVTETWDFTSQIVGSLIAIVTGRVAVGEMMGPLGIAQTAFSIAGEDFYEFLIFLGIIGVNLAVINFLPIPVLDGGHMVFLIYEWIRGKPAPESVRVAATYLGLALIASLMILVIYLDVRKVL